jgi:hypothetical protein
MFSYITDQPAVFWLKPLVSFSAAWAFSIATQPPFRPSSEDTVQRDKQATINFLATTFPKYSTALIFTVEALQVGAALLRRQDPHLGFGSGIISGESSVAEQVGVGMLLGGSLLRIWCYRCLGRFFTYQVSRCVCVAVNEYFG